MADELLIAGVGLNGTSGGWGNTWSNGFTQQSTVVSTVSNDNQKSASSTVDGTVVAREATKPPRVGPPTHPAR